MPNMVHLATVRAGGLSPGELRLRSMLSLPSSGPGPVKLLVENESLTLEDLQAAVRAELDRDR